MAARILVKVQVKFDGTNFNDISAYVTRASVRYGRKKLLDQIGAGTTTTFGTTLFSPGFF